MSKYYDKTTGFLFGDSKEVPLSGLLPDSIELQKEFDTLILSASGWRKVFTVSSDENDSCEEIGKANTVLAVLMADTFASYVLDRPHLGNQVVIGRDTRPTGRVVADIFCRVCLARGLSVRFPGITAAPEVMAYSRSIGPFAYISASHNPIGHNGLKFGGTDGGVFDREQAEILINSFRTRMACPNVAKTAAELIAACTEEDIANVWIQSADEKKAALKAYDSFTREIVSGPFKDSFFSDLRIAAERRSETAKPLSLLVDFNGSARTISIDRDFIADAGFHLSVMNEKPGAIAHRIVPEGDSLLFCAERMKELRLHGTGPERHTLLGYVPDCDGDRGNIVFWNEEENVAQILDAQEVFALSAISELSFLVYSGQLQVLPENRANTNTTDPVTGTARAVSSPKCAVAVNGPTSMRIEAIAAAFGTQVMRAEVGEANVVNLARSLREQGYLVRFLGEGSNGGNITHPAAVRDPLNTVFALIKLLTLDDTEKRKGMFHIWCSLSGQETAYKKGFTFADIRRTLPPFATTSVYESYAQLKIQTTSHAVLKNKFRKVFLREWENGKFPLLKPGEKWTWKAVTHNGTQTRELAEDFSVSLNGGLKIIFYNNVDTPAAFIWMRGSGTEPVFRILADVSGSNQKKEEALREWLSRMVLEADSEIE